MGFGLVFAGIAVALAVGDNPLPGLAICVMALFMGAMLLEAAKDVEKSRPEGRGERG